MSLTKFQYLLQNKTLYMSSIRTLIQKFDKLEGKLYPETIQYIVENGRPMTQYLEQRYGSVINTTPETNQIYLKNFASRTFASCWHISENDNPCMWAIYTPREFGVAIQSTYKRLHDSLKTNHEICIGVVKYQEPTKENFLNPYEHFLHKREPYRFESELRVLININNKERCPSHLDISVNLEELVENVYIKPRTRESDKKIITELMRKHRLNRLVLPSTLEIHYTEEESD